MKQIDIEIQKLDTMLEVQDKKIDNLTELVHNLLGRYGIEKPEVKRHLELVRD